MPQLVYDLKRLTHRFSTYFPGSKRTKLLEEALKAIDASAI